MFDIFALKRTETSNRYVGKLYFISLNWPQEASDKQTLSLTVSSHSSLLHLLSPY